MQSHRVVKKANAKGEAFVSVQGEHFAHVINCSTCRGFGLTENSVALTEADIEHMIEVMNSDEEWDDGPDVPPLTWNPNACRSCPECGGGLYGAGASQMSDEEVAHLIRNAAGSLNEALGIAQRAGLRVELEVNQSTRSVRFAAPLTLVSVRGISKSF